MTTGQNQKKIKLTITSSYLTGFSGLLGIEFLSYTSYIDIKTPTNDDCQNNLGSSPKFGRINCQYTMIATNSIVVFITFLDWPAHITDNNLYVNNGQPSITDFYCDISKANSGVQCIFSDVVNDNIKGNFFEIYI